MLPAILTTILWSLSVVCATRSVRVMGGPEANFWRLAIATFILGCWAFVFGQGVSGASFPMFLSSGVIGVGADVFLFEALPRIGSRLSILIIECGAALFAPLVEWLWLGTKLTAAQMICCVIVLAGVAICLAPGKHLLIARSNWISGIGFGILAAFGNGLGAVFTRKGYEVARLAHEHISDSTSAFQRLIGGLFVAAIFLLVVRRKKVLGGNGIVREASLLDAHKWRSAWPWVLANALAGQTFGVTCYQWALHTTPTGLVLAVVSTIPIAVIPFSYAFENERPSARSVVGGIIAVVGVILLVLAK